MRVLRGNIRVEQEQITAHQESTCGLPVRPSARLVEVSSRRTVTDSQPRHWDEATVEKFVRAIFVVGMGSNVEIANHMKMMKMAHNIKGYKLQFLKDHPHWRTEFRHLNPSAAPSDSGTDDAEEPETATEEKTKEIITQPEEVTTVEIEEVTIATEAAVETEVPLEEEVTVETETPIEEATVETESPAKEVTMETETPAEETTTKTEAEPTVPHGHETTGKPPNVITIGFPLQNSLDCPHCSTHYPGETGRSEKASAGEPRRPPLRLVIPVHLLCRRDE